MNRIVYRFYYDMGLMKFGCHWKRMVEEGCHAVRKSS